MYDDAPIKRLTSPSAVTLRGSRRDLSHKYGAKLSGNRICTARFSYASAIGRVGPTSTAVPSCGQILREYFRGRFDLNQGRARRCGLNVIGLKVSLF